MAGNFALGFCLKILFGKGIGGMVIEVFIRVDFWGFIGLGFIKASFLFF
jgi:hypothetical protein